MHYFQSFQQDWQRVHLSDTELAKCGGCCIECSGEGCGMRHCCLSRLLAAPDFQSDDGFAQHSCAFCELEQPLDFCKAFDDHTYCGNSRIFDERLRDFEHFDLRLISERCEECEWQPALLHRHIHGDI